MSRHSASRLLATNLLQSVSRTRTTTQLAPQWTRLFSQSASRRADDPFQNLTKASSPSFPGSNASGSVQTPSSSSPPQRSTTMQDLVGLTMGQASSGATPLKTLEEMTLAQQLEMPEEENDERNGVSQFVEPYHFHIYSTKHNTHVTVTRPNRNAIVSLSTGNLGFKKSARHSYDAAYQLGNYVMEKLHQMNYQKKIKQMEVVLRGFGPGREAVTKVLLGTQGKNFRNSIIRVSDSTRLKFGGTRSKKPRRLG